jgi:hypothetical protein
MNLSQIIEAYSIHARISEGEAEVHVLGVRDRIVSCRKAGAMWVYCDKIVKDMIGLPQVDAITLIEAEG